MRTFKQRVYHASRSQSFLWKFALVAIGLGVVVGWALSHRPSSRTHLFGQRVLATVGLAELDEDDVTLFPTESPRDLLSALENEIRTSDVAFPVVLNAVPTLAPFVAASDFETVSKIIATRFTADEAAFATDYLASWNPENRSAFERLKTRADDAKPTRFAHYAVGRIHLKRKNYDGAYERFRLESQVGGAAAEESRAMIIYTLGRAKNAALLSQLAKDPEFARYFSPHAQLDVAVAEKDWRGMFKWLAVTQLHSYARPVLLVTLVGGFAWAFFLFNLGEVRNVWSVTSLLCFLGFLAGAVSTFPTVYLVLVEDEILHFEKGADIAHSFAYFIAGVGAREELCKLLLFLPLLPFLIKRGDDLEALTVASFVGLGFAIEENGGYFAQSAAASAPGRFLTANFFHIALTGMNGLALFRACTRGMSGVNEFLMVLPLTIFAHGAYDALGDTTELDGGGFFAMIVYIGFALYYFNAVHPLRTNEQRTVSLTGSFVVGLSILTGTVIAFQMATLGAGAGATLIFSELFSSVVLVFLFFREFHEPLTR